VPRVTCHVGSNAKNGAVLSIAVYVHSDFWVSLYNSERVIVTSGHAAGTP
jgi:hypothetical protein